MRVVNATNDATNNATDDADDAKARLITYIYIIAIFALLFQKL